MLTASARQISTRQALVRVKQFKSQQIIAKPKGALKLVMSH